MNDDNVQGLPQEPEYPTQEIEGQQSEPQPSSEKPTEEPSIDEEKVALENSKNPERTKEYIDKLKTELAEAKAAATAKHVEDENYGASVFDTLRPQMPPQVEEQKFQYLDQRQIDSITNQFVDAEGNVDINGLNSALNSANQGMLAAMQEAQEAKQRIARFEETQQVREAHAVFPELAPKDQKGNKNPNFDPKFFKLVSDKLMLDNHVLKKNITLLEAAQEVRETYQPVTSVNVEKVRSEAVAQYKETQANRNQGPIENGRGESRQPIATQEELRAQTRNENILLGSPSLDERLKSIGIMSRDK